MRVVSHAIIRPGKPYKLDEKGQFPSEKLKSLNNATLKLFHEQTHAFGDIAGGEYPAIGAGAAAARPGGPGAVNLERARGAARATRTQPGARPKNGSLPFSHLAHQTRAKSNPRHTLRCGL
jgi:hypothetical protein